MLGVALPIFSGAAYLTGLAYHQTYLNAFHVPQNLMGKTAADYFVYAHMAVTEAGSKLLGITGAILVAAFIFGGFIWEIYGWIDRKVMESSQRQWLRRKVQSKPLLRLVGRLVLIPMIVVSVFYLLLLLFIVFVAPMIFGQITGKQRAEEDIAKFKLGCDRVRQDGPYCNKIFDGASTTPIAYGFIIDSSEQYVAIYESGTVRTFPTQGKTFTAVTVNAQLD